MRLRPYVFDALWAETGFPNREERTPIQPNRMRSGRIHCVLALALPGCGTETNWVACMIPIPIGVGTETR
jgi:hypothetical protein